MIVDTSVLIDFLRGRETPAVALLEHLEREGTPYRIPVICCQELLQGARDQRQWEVLEEHLSGQRLLWPDEPWESHRLAARIYYDCRRKGITIRSTVDCLIAALAIGADATLLHDDEDFERMRAVCALRTSRG